MYTETTKVPSIKTASDIMGLLAKGGARRIMQELDSSGEVTGLSFTIECAGREVPFELPINPEPIWRYLQSKRRRHHLTQSRLRLDLAQAKRVAWRQVYWWVKAQLALIETGMVEVEQVFLPYAKMENGQTLFEQMQASGFRQKPLPMLEEDG